MVQLLAEGRQIKEIAARQGLNEKTVEFHKKHIQEVFRLRSNADAVLFDVKQGLISVAD